MPDIPPVSAPVAETEYATFLALDWGDQEHAWALQITGQTLRERGKLEHTPEAVEVWAAQLAARFPGQLLAVGLEQSRGALIHLLSKYSHLILYPIHPATAANFRTALFPSGSKDDPKDDPGQVRKFFRRHNSRSRTRIEQRMEEIQKARLLP